MYLWQNFCAGKNFYINGVLSSWKLEICSNMNTHSNSLFLNVDKKHCHFHSVLLELTCYHDHSLGSLNCSGMCNTQISAHAPIAIDCSGLFGYEQLLEAPVRGYIEMSLLVRSYSSSPKCLPSVILVNGAVEGCTWVHYHTWDHYHINTKQVS